MYSIHNSTAPSYLCNIEPVTHTHFTRRSNLAYVTPKIKSQGSKTFKVNAIKLWNELPLSIKISGSKDLFKRRCKTQLMERMKNIEESQYVM